MEQPGRAQRRISTLSAQLGSPAHDGASLGTAACAGIRMGGAVDLGEIKRRVASWHKYLFELAPNKLARLGAEDRPALTQRDVAWARAQYDVVVVGYGAAGASAALDAADAGCKVLLVDRFDGGGSTRRSGGVYYAGGGTHAQRALGVEDDVDSMFAYVRAENQGAVSDATVRAFCEQSAGTLQWLEERVGVPFRDGAGVRSLYAKKTSYPPSSATLYTSGNETAMPFARLARPAARGNRAFGDYLTGNVFFGALEAAVERHANITVAQHTAGVDVVVERGRCVAVRLATLPDVAEGPFQELRGMHVMLHEIGSGSPMFDPRRAMDAQCRALERQLLAAFAVPVELRGVRGGVVLATGGFYFNQEMVAHYAPQSAGNMPLGNLGDDGAGISMALRAGARLARMDRCSAWKFINPPYSFVRGVLVGGASGVRVRNEDVYGAALADVLVREHGGKGWLIIDQAMWDEAQADCLDPDSGLQEDQRMQGLANLHKNHVKADSLAELADKAGMDRTAFLDTMREYNDDAARKQDSRFGKLPVYLEPLNESPFYAINLDMAGNKYWPTPCMTLGGVEVDGSSGQAVADASGRPIEGLYAAGRTAVGIASNTYVSGLSLADCVFTGRRAGRHAAARARAATKASPESAATPTAGPATA